MGSGSLERAGDGREPVFSHRSLCSDHSLWSASPPAAACCPSGPRSSFLGGWAPAGPPLPPSLLASAERLLRCRVLILPLGTCPLCLSPQTTLRAERAALRTRQVTAQLLLVASAAAPAAASSASCALVPALLVGARFCHRRRPRSRVNSRCPVQNGR